MIEPHHHLVTVMAGYADGGEWSPVTLALDSGCALCQQCPGVMVDQDDLSAPSEFVDDECVCFWQDVMVVMTLAPIAWVWLRLSQLVDLWLSCVVLQ